MIDSPYFPRDFISTSDGVFFAVVDNQVENDRVLCVPRYFLQDKTFIKYNGIPSDLLQFENLSVYSFFSKRLGVRLHGVPLKSIQTHYKPRQKVLDILNAPPKEDILIIKAIHWLKTMIHCGLPLQHIGLTGSTLIGAHSTHSDLDFVLYDRNAFHQAREIIRSEIASRKLEGLSLAHWRESYERRGCSITFEEYLWHENRKWNKGTIEGSKFDITLVSMDIPVNIGPVQKCGLAMLRARVTDDQYAFDYPALYRIDHPEVKEVLSFTQTYVGQAVIGETIEISGILENTDSGQRRIVVGSSREAPGEYIRVRRNETISTML